MENNYDSRADTLEHIRLVGHFMIRVANALLHRASIHDQSKLESPEKEAFDKYTPLLKTLEYGSDEYKESLANLKVALQHHYENNSHHPEHYSNGIDGMDIFDLVEMYCDWLAAGQRTKDGSFAKSMEVNAPRFNMSEQLVNIFNNTANQMFIK